MKKIFFLIPFLFVVYAFALSSYAADAISIPVNDVTTEVYKFNPTTENKGIVITKVVANSNKVIIDGYLFNDSIKKWNLTNCYIKLWITDKNGKVLFVTINNSTIKKLRLKPKTKTTVRYMVNIDNNTKYKFNKYFSYKFKLIPYVDIN